MNPASRMLAPLLLIAAIPAAAPARETATAHVAAMAARLAPHVPLDAPDARVDEMPAPRCRIEEGTLVVTTGMLALLRSDAELAMIVGTGLARDHGAAGGMRALVAAGFDGQAALRAWDRLRGTASLATDGARPRDHERSIARQRQAAMRAWKDSSQRPRAGAGFAEGVDSYRLAVLSQLSGWKFATAATPPADSPPATESPAPRKAGADDLLVTYRRSGGFTGWEAELRIGESGSRFVRESRREVTEGPRQAVPAATLEELRVLLAKVTALPPRVTTPEARWLRDGQLRSVELRDAAGGWRSVALSDGMSLTDVDHRLVKLLEDLLR